MNAMISEDMRCHEIVDEGAIVPQGQRRQTLADAPGPQSGDSTSSAGLTCTTLQDDTDKTRRERETFKLRANELATSWASVESKETSDN